MTKLQLLNQPFDGQMGEILRKKLTSRKYNHFIIISAFAKNSGVLRLKDSMEFFKNHGGKIDAYIGIDAHGTSHEALLNLLPIVDNLNLVHDSDQSTTFHSKIYYLSSSSGEQWVAVGSNNLTGGGLWTNIESSIILESSDIIPAQYYPNNSYIYRLFQTVKEFADKFNSASYISVVRRIKDSSDLDELISTDLLRSEVQIQLDNIRSHKRSSKRDAKKSDDPFGSYGRAHIPSVTRAKSSSTRKTGDTTLPESSSDKDDKHKFSISAKDKTISSVQDIGPTDITERVWFEAGPLTGGSRNILDLSKLGRVSNGDEKNTRYETDSPGIALGSVVFFDINPNQTDVEKDITINYNGKDYAGCTIKMHREGKRPNGSWRLQFKGESADGSKLTSAGGAEWLVHKLIIMEKIRTDYYTLSVLREEELSRISDQSIFVARNGLSGESKHYGLFGN